MATEERARFPRSSTGQCVAHLDRSLWIERCTSQVVREKFPKYSPKLGFGSSECCLGLFTLHSSAGVLNGVICLHVDDMLGTRDDSFELKLRELDKLVAFGSMKRQKFETLWEAV